MKIVLLSGGSGQRLWPLSNDVRSKQFLKLLYNENKEPESMVQRVYRQIRQSGIESEIIIATGKHQENSIRNHLGDLVEVVTEPERRDTFPAIALATAYLYYNKTAVEDETVAVMPVDSFADVNFFQKLFDLDKLIQQDEANLGLLGIKPTYPSAKYGYILKESNKVVGFMEKPSESVASEIIAEGAMWNGGIFVFKPSYVIDILKNYIDFSSYEDVFDQYSLLPKTSFDYEVSEKEKRIAMVAYDGAWKDLGTWNTLTEVMEKNSIGKVITSESSENTHVINELDIPVTVIGAKNMVVVASPDGILVSDKIQSAKLKEYIGHLDNSPNYEEMPWGSSKVLEHSQNNDGSVAVTKSITLHEGKAIQYHSHLLREEMWTILSGQGTLVLEGEKSAIKQGDVIHIKKGDKHSLIAETPIKLIEVGIGEEIANEDVIFHKEKFSELKTTSSFKEKE